MEFCSGTGDSWNKWSKKWISVGGKAAHACTEFCLGFEASGWHSVFAQSYMDKSRNVCVEEQDCAFFKKKNVTKDTYGMRSDTALSLVNHSLASLWHFKLLAESEYSFVVPLLLT